MVCLFVLEDRPAHRLAHIHLVRHGDEQWINYLAVRQRLRDHAETREAYAGLKLQLATAFPHDRDSYTSGKATFISRLVNADDQSPAATSRSDMIETDVEPNVRLPGAVRFRRVQPDDVTSVRELHELALRHAGGFIESPVAQMWDSDLDHIAEVYFERGGEFLVGVVGTRIVAMGALRVEEGGRAEVKRMRVHPEYQGRGIGRQLLQLLEARARECGVAFLTLDTTTAQVAARSLYVSAGYEETHRAHRAGLEFIFMKKFLAGRGQTAPDVPG